MQALVHATPTRLLVRGVNWLGDAVMTTPALMRLRELWPAAEITLLTHSKLADLWTGHPAVDQVIAFEKGESALAVARRIQKGQFDAALVLPNSFRSAFEVWLARVPVRAGYGGNIRGFLMTHVVPRAARPHMRKRGVREVKRLIQTQPEKPRDTFPPGSHHVFDYLDLAAALGAKREVSKPNICVREDEKFAFRQKWGLGRKVFGLNPGAEYGPAKRWPVDRFIEVARAANGPGIQWLIFGGAGDSSLASQVESELARDCQVVNLAGKTSLRELCVALACCEAVVTNDTGPMHVAAAVGARVIAPFGSTSPELTGPGNPGEVGPNLITGNAPCAPCFLRECPVDFRCMRGIDVERVVGELITR